MVTKLFKAGRKVVAYIKVYSDKIQVFTGKPSDAVCISWTYKINEMDQAVATASEFARNYASFGA